MISSSLVAGTRQRLALISVTALKAILMTITPLSLDLAFTVSQISSSSPWGKSPYGRFMESVLYIWQILPVDHPAVASSWTVDFFHASPGLYLLVFMLKLPLLGLDLLTGALLYKMVENAKLGRDRANLAFWLWFLNPYVLIVNEMWGAFSLLPTLLALWACASFRENEKTLRAAAVLAGAIAANLFAIMILPMFLILNKQRRSRLILIAGGILGVAIYFGWVSYAGYDPWISLKQYDQFTQYFDEYLISGIFAGPTHEIGLATLGVVLSYAIVARKWLGGKRGVFDATLLTFLVYFAFGLWFPQFLIWMIPFLVLDVAIGGRRLTYMIVLLSSALFLDLVAFYPYFTSNGNALFFIPATMPIIARAVAAYRTFAIDTFVILVAGPLSRAIFIATCLAYSFALVEKQTKFLTSLRKRRV